MNRQDLFECIGNVDEEILERSEKNKGKRKRKTTRWMTAVAAILVIALGLSVFEKSGIIPMENLEVDPLLLEAHAVERVIYPEQPIYPNRDDYEDSETGKRSEEYEELYFLWRDEVRGKTLKAEDKQKLEKFFSTSIWQFLSGSNRENVIYSPLNVYIALGMLAEISDGNSRNQILELLGADSIEALRAQVNEVWNINYRDDGKVTNILASSLWLNEDVTFKETAIQNLVDHYYASVFQGEMGSEELNRTLHTWMNEETGGMLENQIDRIRLQKDTALALATTIYFEAEWHDVFREENTKEGVFLGAVKDEVCDFMNKRSLGSYYWGDKFGAVAETLTEYAGTMYFILPNEGVSIDELLEEQDLKEFIFGDYETRNHKSAWINLSLPKFDVSSRIDLEKGLMELGVTDVFDVEKSDFSALAEQDEGMFISKMPHGVRVIVDEKGVTASAYTIEFLCGSAGVTEEVNFVLDRPFLFVVNNFNGFPLFVGVVNQTN